MRHPIFARVYARRTATQARWQEPHRRELLAGLSGRVLEVGCGSGSNFSYYPDEVSEVVGIEPEPYLRRQATAAARQLRRSITVVDGTAENLSVVTNGLFDAVVFSLVLCSVTDPVAVMREAKRVMRAGAEARFFEHVLSAEPGLARMQHLAAPLWSRAAGGCQPDRALFSAIDAEFQLLSCQKFYFCPGPRIPLAVVAPHILAVARLRDREIQSQP